MVERELKMRVLLVENDVTAAANLTTAFAAENIRADVTDTGEDALNLVRHYDFDLMVLNLTLPDMAGSTVISRMRAAHRDLPVLALAGTLDTPSRVKALAAGADDVVARPIDRSELVARMRAVVRRCRGHSQPVIQVGPLMLNLERHEVRVGDVDIHLSGKEFAILQLLMLRKNMIMTKETILSHLYGGLDEPEPKIIDVFICKIRKKLAEAGVPNSIGTVWGRGYTVRDAPRDDNTPTTPPIRQPEQTVKQLVMAAE